MNDYPINHFLEQLRGRYREANKDVTFLPFFYNVEFLPINSNSTDNQTNTSDQDADFIVLHGTQACFNAANGAFITYPNATARITGDVSGRKLQDRAIALINIFGRGQRPYEWPRPWVIPAKSSWTTQVTNLDAAVNYTLRLTYGGVKAVPVPLA